MASRRRQRVDRRRDTAITETCPGANYVDRTPLPADLVSEWTITCYDVADVRLLALGQVPVSIQRHAQALIEWEEDGIAGLRPDR